MLIISYICLGLSLWIIQNIIHEGCHSIVHWLAGDKIVEFWPFPSFSDELGFSFAHMRYKRIKQVSEEIDGLCSAAPLIFNTSVLIFVFLLSLFGTHSPFLFILAFYNFIDGGFNLCTFYRLKPTNSDGWTWVKLWHLTTLDARCIAVVWQLMGFAFLILELYNLTQI